ncbi:MAG TPA: hypothetical protein VL243_05540 [Vicinamibacterales bacterium]|nr:hypothetical protein [Vicinamibacterales bacterium]
MGARKLVTVVLVAVAVVLAARYLFWNDKRDVRRRLFAMAEAASTSGRATAEERSSAAENLGALVTDDVIIKTDSASFVGGRPAVVRLALDAAPAANTLRVSLEDVQVELIDPATATAFFTLNVSGAGSPALDPLPRQVHATLVKRRGEWLLERGEVLRTLEGAH